MTRAEAKAKGLKRYLGKLCKRGHDAGDGTSERLVSDKKCIHCKRERDRRQHKNDPDRGRERARRWREANSDRHRAMVRKYAKANPEWKRASRRRCKKKKALESVPEELRPIRAELFEINSAIQRIYKTKRSKKK